MLSAWLPQSWDCWRWYRRLPLGVHFPSITLALHLDTLLASTPSLGSLPLEGYIRIFHACLGSGWPLGKYSGLEYNRVVMERMFVSTQIYMMEKAMAIHSSTLAWKIPWTEEPGRLQSMGSLRVRHNWAASLSLFTFMHWRRKRHPTPVFLPGESQGWGSLVGCLSMGLHRVGPEWSDLAAAANSREILTPNGRVLGSRYILKTQPSYLEWVPWE